MFDEFEREAVILHTYMLTGPDFEEPWESRYPFSGRGMRDIVWFVWLLKQTIMQNWSTFVERYGLGIRVGHYPYGSDTGRDAMEDVLRELTGDVSVLVPHDADAPDAFKLEIHEPQGSGGSTKVFADMVEWVAGGMKELIIGQTATTEATSGGIGSDVSTRHAETFERIIRYDAESMADSLTRDLVRILHKLNFGETDYAPRWEFRTENTDSEKWMKGVKIFIENGGKVSQRQCRQMLGIEEPLDDEEVMEPSFGLAMGQMQGGDASGVGICGQDNTDKGGPGVGELPGESNEANNQGNRNLANEKKGQMPGGSA
jgi:phage gp29-like protein